MPPWSIDNVVRQETSLGNEGEILIVSIEQDVRNTIGHQLQEVPPESLKKESVLKTIAIAVVFTCEEALEIDGHFVLTNV